MTTGKNTVEMKKKLINRIKKTNLLLSMILVLSLFLSGCLGAASNKIKSDFSLKKEKTDYKLQLNNGGEITDISLISAFIDVINKNATAQEVYFAIPEKIKEDLTLNEFSLYIKALTFPQSKEISEFKRVSNEKKKEFIVALTTDVSKLALAAENSEFYQLIYTSESLDQNNISSIIGIQHLIDGQAYLSADWIRNVNKIYEFSRLYFNAIEDRDEEMLSWLLVQGYLPPIEDAIVEIENHKASLLIDYYRYNVVTESDKNIPTLLLPNTIQYMQELEEVDENQNKFRTCSFNQINNRITVFDPYPERIKNYHLNVFYEDMFLLTWSSNGIRQNYSSLIFNTILGEPNIRRINMSDPVEEEEAEFWRIVYDEISFIIKGEGNNTSKTWSGVIERLEIDENSTNISLGDIKGAPDSMYYNMPLSDFYRQYPFSPEVDYTIAGNEQDQNIALIVQVDHEKVNRLILVAVYK